MSNFHVIKPEITGHLHRTLSAVREWLCKCIIELAAGVRTVLRSSRSCIQESSNLVGLLNLYNDFSNRPGTFQSFISFLCVLHDQHFWSRGDKSRLTSKLKVESMTTFLAAA